MCILVDWLYMVQVHGCILAIQCTTLLYFCEHQTHPTNPTVQTILNMFAGKNMIDAMNNYTIYISENS